LALRSFGEIKPKFKSWSMMQKPSEKSSWIGMEWRLMKPESSSNTTLKVGTWAFTHLSLYGRKMSIQQIKAYHTKIRGEPRNRFSFMVETTLWRCTDCGALWEKKVEHDCKDDLSRVWSQSDHHREEKSG